MDTPSEALEAVRREAVERLADLRAAHASVVDASRDSNADDEHDPEGATIAFERSQIGTLIKQVEALLVEVDAAHERVVAGSYGVCETCGGPVGEGRLAARPTARTCIGCA